MDMKLKQYLLKKIKEAKNKKEIIYIIKDHKETIQDAILQEIFIKISEIDENGFGKEITIKELEDLI